MAVVTEDVARDVVVTVLRNRPGRYADGLVDAAVAAATRQPSVRAAITVICEAFQAYELHDAGSYGQSAEMDAA